MNKFFKFVGMAFLAILLQAWACMVALRFGAGQDSLWMEVNSHLLQGDVWWFWFRIQDLL